MLKNKRQNWFRDNLRFVMSSSRWKLCNAVVIYDDDLARAMYAFSSPKGERFSEYHAEVERSGGY